MPGYNLIDDFHSRDGVASSSPDWCMIVFRLAAPSTYDRSKRGSATNTYSDAVKLRGKPLVLRDEISALSVSQSKTSHLTHLNATLTPGHVSPLSEIMPGDWLFAWMAHDTKTIDEVIRKVLDGKSANDWHDGLKFMGRVGSVRKTLQQDPGGNRQLRYTMTGTGFTEFDATLFYEPHLAENIPALGQFFAKLGADLNKIIDENGGGISVNKALRLFLDLFLGQGVPRNLGLPSDPDLQSTTGLDAPYSYVVPKEVGAVIGRSDRSKPDLLSSADTIDFLYGLQEYGNQEFAASVDSLLDEHGNSSKARQIAQAFNPQGTKGGGSRRFTGTDMLGIFLPQAPQFSNHSVWSILHQYLNPAVNEMYTTLRVDPSGKVVPTLVARQIPFSTELAPGDPKVTRFLSLPRWVADPLVVKKLDIGRSDAMRINFVHVYGDDGPQSMNPIAGQIVLAPPYRDDLDIARSGLRPYMMTVSNNPSDNVDGKPAKAWMAILSDILMGQHLTLTGLIEMYGIQSPICVGDNLEFDDAVYHIESVTHSCQIEISGGKTFVTTVALSHGLALTPGATDISVYAGVTKKSVSTYDPAITIDSSHDYGDQSALPKDQTTLMGDDSDRFTPAQDAPVPAGTGSRVGGPLQASSDEYWRP